DRGRRERRRREQDQTGLRDAQRADRGAATAAGVRERGRDNRQSDRGGQQGRLVEQRRPQCRQDRAWMPGRTHAQIADMRVDEWEWMPLQTGNERRAENRDTGMDGPSQPPTRALYRERDERQTAERRQQRPGRERET